MSSRLLPKDTVTGVHPVAIRMVLPQATPPTPEPWCPPKPSAAPAHVEDSSGPLRQRISQLEAEVEARAQAAYQRGLTEGEAVGTQKIAQVAGRMANTIDALSSLRARIRHEAEEDAVKLALAVARRIIHRELAIDPSALLGLVKAAFQKLDGSESSRVRVNPEDAILLRPGLNNIEVIPDATLERGSAVFETSRGAMDAGISSQLSEIERGFVDRLKKK